MSPHITRRHLLQTTAVASATGLTGCSLLGSSGGGDTAGYGIRVENDITSNDIAAAEGVGGHTQTVTADAATVTVRGEEVISGGDNEAFYEHTVDVEPESAKTLDERFTMPTGDSLYLLEATLEPLMPDRDADFRADERRDSSTFRPGEFGTPSIDPIRVVIDDSNPSEWLFPEVRLYMHDRR